MLLLLQKRSKAVELSRLCPDTSSLNFLILNLSVFRLQRLFIFATSVLNYSLAQLKTMLFSAVLVITTKFT